MPAVRLIKPHKKLARVFFEDVTTPELIEVCGSPHLDWIKIKEGKFLCVAADGLSRGHRYNPKASTYLKSLRIVPSEVYGTAVLIEA